MSQTIQTDKNIAQPLYHGRVSHTRPQALGKFLFVDGKKFYVRGVTYGTFRLDDAGNESYDPQVVEQDFAAMAANNINAVRTYTVPPVWLLDAAQRHGLYVMVGLPWEQHIAFLDGWRRPRSIVRRVRAGVQACAGHPAVLCFSIGNEIPAPVVRWYGHKRIERFIMRLYQAVKNEDPDALVTYVNYPSTEYLDLSFLDLACFNVYLEERERLESYLARLQNIAGERPLIMAEIGLDSRRNGAEKQAEVLRWQISTAFSEGCAGSFIFAWTDEWYRGGSNIEDWDFGLTTRNREPKPALAAVRTAFDQVPFPPGAAWPHISVVVCSYNGAATLSDCCEGLLELEYPNFEVIVINDGSTDSTAAIAGEYGFRVVMLENGGLSNARNVGMSKASGEIVAYIDDDARPDPHWLHYLAHTFLTTDHAAVGGPNIVPPSDSPVAQCVANAPGGPTHVLLSDEVAEHIPGCNMAFRKSCLQEIGGFDPQFIVAGDDVDVCWRLQQQGWTLGFNPSATVWHHRRNSVGAYWKQQANYGRAEAMLEKKWPEKYNSAGHVAWSGRLYGNGLTQALGPRTWRIYHGTWGSAPFQSVYERAQGGIWSLPLMPEWYLIIVALVALCAIGMVWTPLLFVFPLLLLAVAAPLIQSALGASKAVFGGSPRPRSSMLALRFITAWLHLIQPIARLIGRMGSGLAPWRLRCRVGLALPAPRTITAWRETWRAPEDWLCKVELDLRATGAVVLRGGNFDRWDLEVRGGILGGARTRMVIEEHGGGRQLARFRTWPRFRGSGFAVVLLFAGLAAVAASGGAGAGSILLGSISAALLGRILLEGSAATATLRRALRGSARFSLDSSGKSRPARPYRRLIGYAKTYWRGWLLIGLATLLSSLFALAQPWPMKVLIDNVLGGHALPEALAPIVDLLPGAGTREGLLIWVVAAGLLVFLVNSVLDVVLTFSWIKAGQRMVFDVAADLFAKIQRRSLLFHNRNSVGDAMGRIITDSWSAQTVANAVLFAPAQALTIAIGVVAIMWSMDPGLTLLALGVAPFMAISSLLLGRPIKAAAHVRRRVESRLQSHVQQILSGVPVVQAFVQEEREEQRFKEFTRAAIRAQQHSRALSNFYNLGSGLITVLGTAAILWIGAHHVLQGRLTIGSMLVFFAYVNLLQKQMKVLTGIHNTLQTAGGSVDRAVEVLDTEPEVSDTPGAPVLLAVRGHIRLENVTFGYEPDRQAISDLSLEILPGQTVAIVGPTGAGKTTLVSIVPRFFDPQAGRVLIDGHDVREVQLQSLRSQVALVLQDPFLFPMSIADNIAFGRPDASREEIEAAARTANAHDFILRLPDGYSTVIGERGSTLSGGEKQRLSIARALLKNAPILILDEPTSALDGETEHLLLGAVHRLMQGRTTLIIAHRLSTTIGADRIAVMREGRLIEWGTHAELMGRGGSYARLFRRRMRRRHSIVRRIPANGMAFRAIKLREKHRKLPVTAGQGERNGR